MKQNTKTLVRNLAGKFSNFHSLILFLNSINFLSISKVKSKVKSKVFKNKVFERSEWSSRSERNERSEKKNATNAARRPLVGRRQLYRHRIIVVLDV